MQPTFANPLRFGHALLFMALAQSTSCVIAADDPLAEARSHFQAGRYDAAREAFQEAAVDKTIADRVAIGISRVEVAVGNWEAANSVLEEALEKTKSADVLAELARLQFLRGDHHAAEKNAKAAIATNAKHPVARIVLADVLAETGHIDEALAAYRWFVRYYNDVQPTQAEPLLLVAEGAGQYARWKSVSQIFNFIVNTLCVDALKADKTSWQSYHISGSLLLEKYNRAQALPEFRSALAINPHAVEIHVALGQAALQRHTLDEVDTHVSRALKTNPRHVPALQLRADLLMARGKLDDAVDVCNQALKVNPRDQGTLGRKAAIFLIQDGVPEPNAIDQLLDTLFAPKSNLGEDAGRFDVICHDLTRHNPRPGYFLTFVGQALESQRRFGAAERFYLRTIKVMPQLSQPKTALGMLYMRIGQTERARKLIDQAFKADPYHVRVSNMRKVLKVLEGYDTIKTDHFIIHVDTKLDQVLGEYMAEYLEEVYPDLVKHFGYEPEQRTHFEIYNNAKGLSAHQWFSARMVGLPWIQTIGASTGVIVALASPTAKGQPFNWARVVKHEFTHVITLQQTKFNIPHWFTEALAVTAEGYPRPSNWDDLLKERVPAGKMWSLDELNDIFRRPKSPADWQFAYCQSRLYAQYMIDTYGAETISKMLDAYRKNMPTKLAIPHVFKVDVEAFEKGYHEFLRKIVGEITGGDAILGKPLGELAKAYEANKEDLDTAAAYAWALFRQGKRAPAREIATTVLNKDRSNPVAAVVAASLELLAEDVPQATKILEAAYDAEKPHMLLLKSLLSLRIRQKNYDAAAKLAETGLKTAPHDRAFLRGRIGSLIELDLDDKGPLIEALTALTETDADNASARKRLAQLHLSAQRFKAAAKYAKLAMHIDVLDAEIHDLLGLAYSGLKQHREAIREFDVAIELKPADDTLELHLAEAYVATELKDKARDVAKRILERSPDHAKAKALLDGLGDD